ncbi:MAG TPA: hypothetical protein VNB24_03735 [Acidimicrobiales bacterium]|nr:hypothetical protein [Acidimicrobiales bacterium]
MTRARTRRGLLAAVLLGAAVGGWIAGARPASAAITSATPSPTSVLAAPDYATATYGDAWDYANAEDFDSALKSWMVGASNVTSQNGMLSFDMTRMGQLPLVRGFGDITIPWGRDASLNPIPAATYTRLSFRMNAQISQPTSGQVVWMNCGNFVHECHGGQPITINPGWHTYDIALANQYNDLPAAWAGQIHSLVIVPVGANLASGHIDLDWARLYQAGAPVAVDLADSNPGGRVTASWSAAPGADYAATANRAAVFASTTSSSTTRVNFNAPAYPPGTYRFYGTDTDGTSSAPGPPLTIGARVNTSKLLPEVPSGADYASTVRGDAWDFAQTSDVKSSLNAALSFDGQLLHGRNAAPYQNDPWVELPVAPPIDGSRFHRLSMRVHFDGDFRLTDDAGGGMNARVYWGTTNSAEDQVSQDILVYPGWQTITFDMSAPQLHDEGQPGTTRQGWVGRQIKWFRIDPNEDRGERTWAIDWVRLGGTSPFGSFDAAQRVAGGIAVGGWAIDADTVNPIPVHVYVGSSAHGVLASDRRPDVAAVYPAYGQEHGFNTVVPAAPGRHRVCVYGINQGAGANSALGCRDVTVDSQPFGSFDRAARVAGGISVGGWAIDADTAASTTVHVYVDHVGHAIDASGFRPDVGAAFPSYGLAHGFDAVVPAAPGEHNVCTYAINVSYGSHVGLACRTVTVDPMPFGSLDIVSRTSDGIRVAGWAIDPDTAAPIPVHVYVDTAGHNLGDAALPRADVAAAFPSYGTNHGYDTVVPAGAGPRTVCAYGINQGAGGNVKIGCRRIE